MSVHPALVPATVLVAAHRILKNLHESRAEQSTFAQSEHTQAALGWLEQGSFIESLTNEAGELNYQITQWGRDALLGRSA